MPARLKIAYFAHSLRSDWNNGNAHFLRGLLRALGTLGHQVEAFEPKGGWSLENLLLEPEGAASLAYFASCYPDLKVSLYEGTEPDQQWPVRLAGYDAVILHEWNPPELARLLLSLRDSLGFKLLFHDTHHRASSSPGQIARFMLAEFDGVLAFGDALRAIYAGEYGLKRVWTLHEAADTTVFKPMDADRKEQEIVWIGNWGEGERSREICEYLLEPAKSLRQHVRTRIYGVRYPEEGLQALHGAGVEYGGYLQNLRAPEVYARARLTVHIPRQQYTGAMRGIPTIRVFEALACGIPLVSAPWQDSEELFRRHDFAMAANGQEMLAHLRCLLREPQKAADQASRGLETVLARHTCLHRARELTAILEELAA